MSNKSQPSAETLELINKQIEYLAEFKAQDDELMAAKIRQQEQRDELNILLIQILLFQQEHNSLDNDQYSMINLRHLLQNIQVSIQGDC